jgi:hypothetical protein
MEIKYNGDNTRVTPSVSENRKNTQSQDKGIRVYSADRYIDCDDHPFVQGIKKVTCGVATFFRRLVGQAIDVQIGKETVTVNKNSFSKYLVRQITGVPTPDNKAKIPAYNKACKLAYSALRDHLMIHRAQSISAQELIFTVALPKDFTPKDFISSETLDAYQSSLITRLITKTDKEKQSIHKLESYSDWLKLFEDVEDLKGVEVEDAAESLENFVHNRIESRLNKES